MSRKTPVAIACTAVLLVACGSSGQEELQAWMAEQRAITKPQVQPIPEPKKFTPQAYTQEAFTDPFSNQ